MRPFLCWRCRRAAPSAWLIANENSKLSGLSGSSYTPDQAFRETLRERQQSAESTQAKNDGNAANLAALHPASGPTASAVEELDQESPKGIRLYLTRIIHRSVVGPREDGSRGAGIGGVGDAGNQV